MSLSFVDWLEILKTAKTSVPAVGPVVTEVKTFRQVSLAPYDEVTTPFPVPKQIDDVVKRPLFAALIDDLAPDTVKTSRPVTVTVCTIEKLFAALIDDLPDDDVDFELTKVCSTCHEEKPIDLFDRRGENGRQSNCKSCRHKYNATRPKYEVTLKEKKCRTCGVIKPRDEFYENDSIVGGLASSCIQCDAARRKELKDWMDNKRCGKCCKTCGDTLWQVLEFAHLDREDKAKDRNGNTIAFCKLGSIKAMEAEFPKTKFLCPFCHRIETKEENDELWPVEENDDAKTPHRRLKDRSYAMVNAEKLKRAHCIDCNRAVETENYCGFDFDHKNPEDKIEGVCSMVKRYAPQERIEAEMAKCDLRCATCHSWKTLKNGERQQKKGLKRKFESSTSS